MISSFLSNYFGFNKQQRNGLMVLMAISFFLLLVRIIYPYFLSEPDVEIKELPLVAMEKPPREDNDTAGTVSMGLFKFDPNRVRESELKQLGVPAKTARTLINLRSKGFVFRKKEDLLKVYGMNQHLYSRLENYIEISQGSQRENRKNNNVAKAVMQSAARIEINNADSTTLVTLKGIGPSFARRIIKYRSLLGGYVSLNQLKEVYGLGPELYQQIEPFFRVDASLVRKIDLNNDDFKRVNSHPYISYEMTKTIFDWRRKTRITPVNLPQILNNDSIYNKLLPYLKLD